MTISDALTELGRQINLPELGLDEGMTSIEFDAGLIVDLESLHEGASLRISAAVMPLDEERQDEALLEQMLHASLLGLGAAGAHFSVDEDSEEILMERTLDMEALDFTDFSQALEGFVNQLEGWRNTLGQASQNTSAGVLSGSAGMVRI